MTNVNCAAESTSWEIDLFRAFNKNDTNFLGANSVVRFRHSRLHCHLGVDENNVIRWLEEDKASGDVRSLWIVENLYPSDGEYARWSRSCRVRHFCSGSYLCVSKSNDTLVLTKSRT